MAEITLGIYTTHGPQLNTSPKEWLLRVPADKQRMHWYRGKTYSFDELIKLRSAEKLDEASSAAMRQLRWEACQRGVKELVRTWEANKPDVCVIFGNDQRECFHEDITPMFTVYGGDEIVQVPLAEEQEKKLPPGILETEWAYRPEERVVWPGLPELANGVIAEGQRSRFDLAWSLEWPDKPGAWHSGTPHSFSWIFRRIMSDKVVPTLPLVANTFFPPNQPTAERCFEFGQMVGRAIANWDKDLKVGIFGSGGMSHFVIDSDIDQLVFDALKNRDADALKSIPQDLLMSGTSELRNWISAAGALFETNLSGDVIDYQPCYRSEAGTGTAQGFVAWT